jgi:hypothetical protein
LISLSEVLLVKDENEKAASAASQAIELLEPLANTPAPTESTARDRWLFAMAFTDRGAGLRELGKESESKSDLDHAIALAESFSQQQTEFDDAQFQLACACNHKGDLLARQGSGRIEAESLYKKAYVILERLARENELSPLYREEWARTLSGRATTRVAAGNLPAAESDCREGLKLVDELISQEKAKKGASQSPQYASLRGRILEQQSQILSLRNQHSEASSVLDSALGEIQRAMSIDPARKVDEAVRARLIKRRQETSDQSKR